MAKFLVCSSRSLFSPIDFELTGSIPCKLTIVGPSDWLKVSAVGFDPSDPSSNPADCEMTKYENDL